MRLILWCVVDPPVRPEFKTIYLTRHLEQLAEYGAALIEQNPGQHFTFISVKQDATSNLIVRKARSLVQLFQENGVAKDKLVVSIPATEQGVHATRLLVKEDGMLVNLTMVAGMSHAAMCAEAGAAWVTFNLDGVSHPPRLC